MLTAVGLTLGAFAVVACGRGELGLDGLRASDKPSKLEEEQASIDPSFGGQGAGPMQGVDCSETIADLKRRFALAGATNMEFACKPSRFGGIRVSLIKGETPSGYNSYIGGNYSVTYTTVDACVAAMPEAIAEIEKTNAAVVPLAFCNNLSISPGQNPYTMYYSGYSNAPVSESVEE